MLILVVYLANLDWTTTSFSSSLVTLLHAVYADTSCKPRPTLMSTRINDEEMEPRFKEINQCSGHDKHYSSMYRCNVISQDLEYYKVESLKNPLQGKLDLKMHNHTKCEMQCVCETSKNKCDKLETYNLCPQGLRYVHFSRDTLRGFNFAG